MNCQECGKTATFFLTNIIDDQKREVRLCDDCARKHHLLPDGPNPQLNLTAIVQMAAEKGEESSAGPACPVCGIHYAAFRADGRFGCPNDYDAFQGVLEPLLERIHRATRHVGKIPHKAAIRRELDDLRERLGAAVAAERYEEAALLRDTIRQKEPRDES